MEIECDGVNWIYLV